MISRTGVFLAIAIAAAGCSSTTAGPDPVPDGVLRISLIAGNQQSDSVVSTLEGIQVLVEQQETSSSQFEPFDNRRLGLINEGECGGPIPAELMTESDGIAEFSWLLGEVSGDCELLVSADRDDPGAGPFVTIVATALPGRPVTELIPPGTGISAPTTLRIAPAIYTIQDQFINPLEWEIQIPDPGPILLLEGPTPSGTEFFLTATQPGGSTLAELHTIYGVVAEFDVYVCQEGGNSVVHMFNPTPEVPTPPCA